MPVDQTDKADSGNEAEKPLKWAEAGAKSGNPRGRNCQMTYCTGLQNVENIRKCKTYSTVRVMVSCSFP